MERARPEATAAGVALLRGSIGGALILAAGAVVARAGARRTDVVVLAGARG